MMDYTNTPDDDLDFSRGDLAWADADRATEQHKAAILMAGQGDYKESPLTGVGIIDHINSENDGGLLRVVAVQMRRDGIKVNRVGFDHEGQLIIDGAYEDNNRRS